MKKTVLITTFDRNDLPIKINDDLKYMQKTHSLVDIKFTVSPFGVNTIFCALIIYKELI